MSITPLPLLLQPGDVRTWVTSQWKSPGCPGHVLEEVYTSYETDDLIEATIFSGLVSGAALADTSKLEAIIAAKVTPELLAEIAEEHRKGRLLLVGTTNLDAGRRMVWNMGAIAASGHPDAAHLFRQVILASASIPSPFRRRSSR